MSNLKLQKKEILNRVSFFFLINILLFSLLLSSCASNQLTGQILSFIVPDDIQQYYIRSINIKENNIDCDIDFTIHTRDFKICNPVTVNYTLNGSKETPENLTVSFEYGDNKVSSVYDIKLLYKNISPVALRYTSLIDEDSFRNMIYSSTPISIIFTDKNGTSTKIYHKKLENTIFKLRDVIE